MFLDNEMAVASPCSIDEANREAFRFFPNVVKEKQKKCIYLGLLLKGKNMYMECLQLG